MCFMPSKLSKNPKLRSIYGIATAAVVFAVVLVSGCSKSASADRPAAPAAFPVKVITAQAQLVPQATEYLATLKSRNAAALQPQVEGDITKIYVHSGQRVEAGTPILQIDQSKQEATVHNQEAAYKSKQAVLEQARIDFDRKSKLYAQGIVAKADYDSAQAAFNSAKADVEALDASIREQRVQLRYYTVNAPTDGTAGDIPVRVGDHVTNQTMLTTLDRDTELEAYISVPSEKASSVRMGMPVDILDEAGKPAVRTRVAFISPRVDTESQTLLVKTVVPNPLMKFRNAQQVHSRVVWSEERRPMIPVTAVSRLSGKIFAFVADGSSAQAVARQRIIEVGDLVGNDYVVLVGIKPGEQIIVSGVQMLADGMPVVTSN